MSNADRLDERSLGPWRWLRIEGPRDSVFFNLGRACRDEIREWVRTSADLPALEGFRGSVRLAELVEATTDQCPEQISELVSLAEGAGVDPEDLLLMNLRGDLTDLGEGCSDVAIATDQTRLVAHNEDGAPELDGLCSFVSLHVEGQVPVTSVWYPGFLPGMTCWLNGAGLACGVDHIPVTRPGVGAGRHFVARKLQEASTLERLIEIAQRAQVAGGYAYTVGKAGGDRIVNLELGPGGARARDIAGLHAHTNHFIYLDDPQNPDKWSRQRLSALRGISAESSARGLLSELTSSAGGIKRDALDGDPLLTLCSIVFDLSTETASMVLRHDPTVHSMSFESLVAQDW